MAQLLETLTAPGMEVLEVQLSMDDLELHVRRQPSDDTTNASAAPPAAAGGVAVLAPTPHLQPALHLAPAPYARCAPVCSACLWSPPGPVCLSMPGLNVP